MLSRFLLLGLLLLPVSGKAEADNCSREKAMQVAVELSSSVHREIDAKCGPCSVKSIEEARTPWSRYHVWKVKMECPNGQETRFCRLYNIYIETLHRADCTRYKF